MYDHMLYEMAKAVSEKCGIRMDDAFNALIGYWQDKIACPWDIDDMLDAARRAGKPITRADALELLKRVFDKYDPELGITWLTLDVALDDYHLRFDSLPLDAYPGVYGVFKVWREHQPVAHQFGLFQDKENGNLPEALAFSKTLAQEAPGAAVFVGCELPESSREAQPWLTVLFENEQFSITQGVTHVRMD
jgi:hypothetical protein